MCDSVPGVHRGLHLFRLPLSLAAGSVPRRQAMLEHNVRLGKHPATNQRSSGKHNVYFCLRKATSRMVVAGTPVSTRLLGPQSDLLDIEDLVGGLELRLVDDAVPACADLLRDDVVIHLDRASLGCRVYRIHDGVEWYELYLAQLTAAQIVRSRGVQMSPHESWPRAVLSHEGAR
ncbi:uncharacterized protein LOC142776319 isoform X1 [Rhipicephalus microplus]|uniref:uncharacterized protein LOC142776319 isoform X1 n=1 Tax=Rhipicephalus microplus TaxID=6941 RepID=UPI003F6CCEA7